jgi:class 3 adenylate cyclase
MILRYRKDQRLLQRLGAKYTVGVRFGLHFGWAIEGVIGSDHKIDVSHIGTHIDRSKRLTSIC